MIPVGERPCRRQCCLRTPAEVPFTGVNPADRLLQLSPFRTRYKYCLTPSHTTSQRRINKPAWVRSGCRKRYVHGAAPPKRFAWNAGSRTTRGTATHAAEASTPPLRRLRATGVAVSGGSRRALHEPVGNDPKEITVQVDAELFKLRALPESWLFTGTAIAAFLSPPFVRPAGIAWSGSYRREGSN